MKIQAMMKQAQKLEKSKWNFKMSNNFGKIVKI